MRAWLASDVKGPGPCRTPHQLSHPRPPSWGHIRPGAPRKQGPFVRFPTIDPIMAQAVASLRPCPVQTPQHPGRSPHWQDTAPGACVYFSGRGRRAALGTSTIWCLPFACDKGARGRDRQTYELWFNAIDLPCALKWLILVRPHAPGSAFWLPSSRDQR